MFRTVDKLLSTNVVEVVGAFGLGLFFYADHAGLFWLGCFGDILLALALMARAAKWPDEDSAGFRRFLRVPVLLFGCGLLLYTIWKML